MRRCRVHICLAAVVVLSARAALAQSAAPSPTREQVLSAASDIMRAAIYCTLATAEGEQPQARILDPFEPEAGLTVWFATKPNTRKVAQIRKDPHVALLYFDTKSLGYVTLLGEAALVTDAAEKAKRWKDRWAALYRDRNRGDDYLLVRVTPRRVEVSSPSRGMNNDPATWLPVVLELR